MIIARITVLTGQRGLKVSNCGDEYAFVGLQGHPNSMTRKKVNMRKHTRSRFGLLLGVVIVAAFTVVPSAAVAQDPLSNPSAAEYNAPIPGGGTAGQITSGGATEPKGTGAAGNSANAGPVAESPGGLGSNIGSLPFTGMDVLILFGAAVMLTGTGLALRRLSAPRGQRV